MFQNKEINRFHASFSRLSHSSSPDHRDFENKNLSEFEQRPGSSKKEKRNRKFFLKRNTTLIAITIQTGSLEILSGQDFIHCEIMQGGHLPLNKYNLKDLKTLAYKDDQDYENQNVQKGLQIISEVLKKQLIVALKLQKQIAGLKMESQQTLQITKQEDLNWEVKMATQEEELKKLKQVILEQHQQLLSIIK